MKNVGLILGFCFLMNAISAQISVTNTTFPVAGDTLKYALSLDVAGLNMGTTNGPQTWNFSALNAGVIQNEIYSNASSGADAASFPEANLLLTVEGQEQYLRSTSTKIEGIGLGGANDFIDAPIVIKYSKRPSLRVAPLNFINSTSSTSEFRVDISASLIPPAIKNLIPLNFDSIRIQFANSAKGVVDAYGTLKMQNKDYQVLREKVETNSDTKVFLKLFGLWIDPLPLLGGNVPPGFENLLGQDTTITYNFYTDIKKEILVSAEYSTDNTLQQVIFANLGGLTSSQDIYTPEVKLFPNPANEILILQTPDLKEGGYLLTISDITGRLVYAEPTALSPNGTKEINISGLDKGTYLLNIRDQFNTFSGTSKFIIK